MGFYIKTICSLILGFSSFILLSQEKKDVYIDEMNKVFQSLNTNEAFSMKIDYVEIRASGESEVVSTCDYYKKASLGCFIFEDNESMVNKDYFVKVNHITKEMIIVEQSEENNKRQNKSDALQQFDPKYFDDNGYSIDSLHSKPQKGILTFKSTINPYYKKIEVRFDTQSYFPISYTLYFSQIIKGAKAYQIQMKDIHFGEFDKSLLEEDRFFSIKSGQVVPTERYKTYTITTL